MTDTAQFAVLTNHSHCTWEELVGNEMFMRDVVKFLVEGNTYSDIRAHYDLSWETMMRVAARVVNYVAQETVALAAVWQGAEFRRLEDIKKNMLPGLTDPNQKPSHNDLTAYTRLVMTELAVLTLNRGTMALPDAPGLDGNDDDDTVMTKAKQVRRYSELVKVLAIGVVNAGYGDGTYEEGEDDEDELLDARADNSDTIEDAVVLDSRADHEADLAPTGTWVDGKWQAG